MPVEHVWGLRATDGMHCQFGTETEVFGKPTLIKSRFLGGQIFGHGEITNSLVTGRPLIAGQPVISDSAIMGVARIVGTPTITNSTVSDNAVITDEVTLINSDIMGFARVYDKAQIINATVSGYAIIKGDAVIQGPDKGFIEIGDYVLLDRGVWTRAPLSYVCHKSGLVVTESSGDLVNINCTTNTVKKILGEGGTRYGKLLGMTQEEIDEVKYYTEVIAKETGKCY